VRLSPKEYGVEMWHGFETVSSEDPVADFMKKKGTTEV
jgi:hypothetical protein